MAWVCDDWFCKLRSTKEARQVIGGTGGDKGLGLEAWMDGQVVGTGEMNDEVMLHGPWVLFVGVYAVTPISLCWVCHIAQLSQ